MYGRTFWSFAFFLLPWDPLTLSVGGSTRREGLGGLLGLDGIGGLLSGVPDGEIWLPDRVDGLADLLAPRVRDFLSDIFTVRPSERAWGKLSSRQSKIYTIPQGYASHIYRLLDHSRSMKHKLIAFRPIEYVGSGRYPFSAFTTPASVTLLFRPWPPMWPEICHRNSVIHPHKVFF
jgi:hypothetical protein